MYVMRVSQYFHDIADLHTLMYARGHSRVVVHGVGAAVQGLDVVWRKVVWRLIGAWQHADHPLARLVEHTISPLILGSSHGHLQHSDCIPETVLNSIKEQR